MPFVLNKRLLFSCLYLGALFLTAGTVFYVVQGFEGTVFLQRGVSESLAFRASTGGLALGVAQRNVPPDLLLLDNPRVARVLRKNQNYDAMVLPFSLRLDEVEVLAEHPPRHWLHVDGPGESRRVALEPGASVALSGETLQVERIGTWAGLVRTASGRPMAAVSLSTHGPPLFLDDGRWQIPMPGLAIGFFWHPDETSLAAAGTPSLEALRGARWGVRDGKAIQWLDNFAPGTGLRLRDGARVTLAADERDQGRIRLAVSGPSGDSEVSVPVNAGGPEDRFLFEDPAATGCAVELHAWREDEVRCRVLMPGGVEERLLAPGDSWQLPGEGETLALQQVMARGIAVPSGAVHAAYLRVGEQTVTLREGLAETVGEHRLRYEREPVAPDARYRISAVDPSGEVRANIALEAGDSARVGAWVLSLAEENPFAPAGIAVDAARRPGGFVQYLGLGLFIAGSFGLVIARFGANRAASDQ